MVSISTVMFFPDVRLLSAFLLSILFYCWHMFLLCLFVFLLMHLHLFWLWLKCGLNMYIIVWYLYIIICIYNYIYIHVLGCYHIYQVSRREMTTSSQLSDLLQVDDGEVGGPQKCHKETALIFAHHQLHREAYAQPAD